LDCKEEEISVVVDDDGDNGIDALDYVPTGNLYIFLFKITHISNIL
jgi:hypothetical protein